MKVTLTIQNLKCGGCSQTIISKLNEIEHVTKVEVDLENSNVSLDIENENVLHRIKEKLKLIGYPTINDENSIITKAKSYVSCASGKFLN